MSDATGRVLERITDAFFAVDSDWRFTYVNRPAAGLFERPREELSGRVLWDVVPDAVEWESTEGFYRAMRDLEPVTTEFHHDRLDSWFEARAHPDERGLSVYLTEVTDRRRRESERLQHAAAVEAMDDGVVTLDDAYRVVSVNSAIVELFGVGADELVGDHVERVIEAAEIADEDAVAIGRAIDEVGAGNADQRTVEVPYAVSGRSEGVAELRVAPVEAGEPSIAAIVRDVTDQRDYERLVHSLHEITRWLLESSDPEEICAIAVHAGSDLLELPISGIWLLDDQQGYLDPIAGTAGAHEEFGGLPRFRPGEGLVWDVFEAGEPELFDDLNEVDGVFNPDTPLRSEIIAPIGTYGALMTGSFDPNRFDETDLELIATLTENTRAALDRAERERVLRERTDSLERQSERLEAVATVLSEDLKEELATVADAMENDRDAPEKWEFPFAKDRVTATLDRTERLIDDIREYARNATSVGQRAPIDLEVAIEDAVESSRLEHAAVVVDDGATLRADPDRFRYLLETVFDDAASRSTGEVTVQVGTLGLESHSEGARGFFILDDASKNPPSATAAIPDLSLDPEESGEGLGLAVARAIAEAHDWSVSIGVGENGGTRFEVRDVTTLEST
ncbi:PAS domain-containing protein [Halovivax sp.]|uniref:sensor histidine kinase n=1 Tax=Halovivax sp. TaxID=1935978 RepID=UPI0025B84018|nr:PAS domain-containing protein [Halovivax sp.]